jgi:hypothetical protein
MADNHRHPYNRRKSLVVHWHHLPNDCWLIRSDVGRVLTIDDLSDDVLLEIFDFYVVKYQGLLFREPYSHIYDTERKIESWQSLVHVCRRWRCLVFGSPRRLNLQICCTPSRSARTRMSLDVWPALPLLINEYVSETSLYNVIAGLEQLESDRISQINLDFYATWQVEKLWTAMQVPFPELEGLYLEGLLRSYVPILPDSFLGGSAPRLRHFYLDAIPFPGLPKLLLSTTHLVNLYLCNIPHSGYISPEAMATCLSMLTSLEALQLEFKDPQSYPDLRSRRPFPPTRSVLSTLTIFWFKGVNEYLEEFVARIDAPQLYRLSTTFFNHCHFKAPELGQFIGRTPILGAYDEARLIFCGRQARVRLRQCHPERSDHAHKMVEVEISSIRQLSNLAQICTLSLRSLLTMENLYIDGDLNSPLAWELDIDNTKWLDLLLPFTAVKNLYLSKLCSRRIALALQELTGGRRTDVLPALQNVLSEEFPPSKPVQKCIAQFISARQLTNHPVAISVWDRDPVYDIVAPLPSR